MTNKKKTDKKTNKKKRSPKAEPQEHQLLNSDLIGKWILMTDYIMKRKDGRDVLNYIILKRALLELKQRRLADMKMKAIIADILDRKGGLHTAEAPLNRLRELVNRRILKPGEVDLGKGNWDKDAAREMAKC